jgi:hypothetical protein
VSGSGDGGLIDFVAAALANFDHAELIHTITNYTLAELDVELDRSSHLRRT